MDDCHELMGSLLNHIVVSPLPEIQVADEPVNRLERSDSIPLHAFALPLPADEKEKACDDGGDEEIEPALYKKVIYIPDVAQGSNRGKRARNNTQEGSPCFDKNLWEEEKHEQVEDRRSSNKDKTCYQWCSMQKTGECLASYRSEWTHCFELGVIVASHYLFWENIVWGIFMGAWLQQQTRGKVGSVEVFSSTLLCGSAFVLLGGQALLIAGVSAPTVIFIVSVSDVADRLLIDFLPWMGWVGIWGSLVLVILAVSGACRFTATAITFFTWEAIQIFVGMSFVWNAVEEIVKAFNNNASLDSSMLSLWLATSSFVVSTFLSQAGRFRLFNRKLCRAVGNCALSITLLLCTGVTYLPKLDRPHLQRLAFPSTGFRTDGVTELGSLVNLKNVPLWAIFLAAIPGSLLASMIFVDHNAASILIQYKVGSNASRTMSRNWDISIIAILVFMCGIFGLPFCYGLFFQSLKHVQALTHDKHSDLESQESQNDIRVQRISGLIASLLSGLPLVPGLSWITAKIPLAVVVGLFIEMALQTLTPLRFFDNTRVLLTDPSLCSVPSRQFSSIKAVLQYTSIQFACTLVIFATSKTPAAIIFPLFILLMIWLRHCPLRSLFIKKGLDKLDRKLTDEQPKIQTTGMKIFNNPHARGRNIHNCASQNRQNNKVGRRKTMGADKTPDQAPLPWNNNSNPTALPPATKRRLNERRSRRNKRMKKTLSLDPSQQCDVNTLLHTVVLPLPCRYKLKNPEEEESSSFSFSTSRSIMKQMSTHLIPKLKKSSELQNPIEMHSNILYDPGSDTRPNTYNSMTNLSPARSASKPNRGDCVDYTTDGETLIKVVNSQSSQYPNAQTQQNSALNQRKEGSTVCAPAVVHEIRPLPKPTKHDIFPIEGRIQPKKKISNAIDETSRRTRMILNQRRWPSNKPMPSVSKGPNGG